MLNESMTTRHIIPLLSVAMLLMCLPAFSQDGSTAYNFLNVTPSAHAYALGGHNISVIDHDINLIEQNPALLGPEMNKQIGLNYMRYLGGSNFAGARYGQQVGQHGAWAMGLQYFGYGSMEGYDIQGVSTGKFSASDIAFNATYSHDINDYFRGGITAKYLYSKYEDYTAGAVGVDLGVNYYNPLYEFSASLVIKNLGGQIKKFADSRDKLPIDVQLGATKLITGTPFRVSLTAYGLTKWHQPYYSPADKNNPESELVKHNKFGSNLLRHLVFGVEFLPNNNMYVALAYNHKTRTDMSSYQRSMLSGFSAGAGLRVNAFSFGVALAQPHSGATTFMLNVSTSLGELLR